MAHGEERTDKAAQAEPHHRSTEAIDAVAVTDEVAIASTTLGIPEGVSGVHGTWGDPCYETQARDRGQRRLP